MYKLPELPFDYNALEPHFDAQTMEIHHSKHHAGYVAKLNAALDDKKDLQKLSVGDLLVNINDVPKNIREAVINNAGGHANHSLFWTILSPSGGGKPVGELAKKIDKTFGSFDKFKTQFSEKAGSLFGSGWAFLIITPQGELKIKRHSFQNSPLMHGNTPILGLDVWEHAYYLKYQNRRADYINAFWNIVNWKKAEENFQKSS